MKNIGQSGGASRWRVCYQRGLPRLVFRKEAISTNPKGPINEMHRL